MRGEVCYLFRMHNGDTQPMRSLPPIAGRGIRQKRTIPDQEVGDDLVLLSPMETLTRLRQSIHHTNEVYASRDILLSLVLKMAMGLHLPCGITYDRGTQEGWQTVVFLTLPSGQVSWHIPDERMYYFQDVPFVSPTSGEWDPSTVYDETEKAIRMLAPQFLFLLEHGAETELMLPTVE